MLDKLCVAQPQLPINETGPVFLPRIDECCGKILKISSRSEGCEAKLYTRTGVKTAKMYQGDNLINFEPPYKKLG